MIDTIGEANLAALIGLFGGVLLGLAARLGRFCTLGAIEDALYGGSTVRLRMWGLAIGVAILGSFGLLAAGLVQLSDSFYLSLRWSPVASIVGGVLFGYGMAIAGNCGFGAIARLGGGDLRSFVIVLVMGIATYVTLSGPLAPLRVAIFDNGSPAASPQGIAHMIGAVTNIGPAIIGLVIGALVCITSLSHSTFRADRSAVFWSVAVGIAVISAWAGTNYLTRTGFADIPTVSHTFARPVGEAILYFMTSTGQTFSFALGSVTGVWIGAFVGSLIKGHFRWEACEDPRELRRQIFGAGIMGVGASIAVGCSIGQGLSAMSVLSYSAPVTLLSIFAGAALGLKQLITGFGLNQAI